MSKVRSASLVVVCAALAACSDSDANHTETAPEIRPAFLVAPADLRGGATGDGPFDLSFARE